MLKEASSEMCLQEVTKAEEVSLTQVASRLLAVFNACKATHGGHSAGAPSHPPS